MGGAAIFVEATKTVLQSWILVKGSGALFWCAFFDDNDAPLGLVFRFEIKKIYIIVNTACGPEAILNLVLMVCDNHLNGKSGGPHMCVGGDFGFCPNLFFSVEIQFNFN